MKLRTSAFFLSALFILLVSAGTTTAQGKKVNVNFKAGTSGATYSNTVSGNGSVDYIIKAKGGQQMSVTLTSPNSSLYFAATKAGSVEAIADAARDATTWSGTLPDDGTYVVRVYLFRNAARTTKRPVSFKIRFDVD